MAWAVTLRLALALAGTAPPTGGTPVAQPAAASEEPLPRFKAGAALLQLGTLLALDTAWYEWQIELNKQDFDFARTFADQWRRLATPAGHRFDDNERYLNFGHAFFGALYYQTARANGGNVAVSYLFNVGASTLWEVGVEHREVISVTDHLITGPGGAPIGEALHRVSDVFARGVPTFRNRLLMGLASPMRLAAWLMGEAPHASGEYDRHGLDASVLHRFDLAVGGIASVTNGSSPAATGAWVGNGRMDLEVIAVPPLSGEALHNSGHLRGGEISRFVVDYAGTGRAMRAFTLAARTTLFGTFDGRRAAGPDGGATRTRVMGAACAFELAYDTAGGLTDFVTLAHLIGPTAEVFWSRDRLALRAELSAYGDFAMIRPMAIGTGTVPALTDGAKSTLQRFDYYYGWGGTTALRLEVASGAFRAGAAAEWNHVDSIEGLDRYQEAFVSPTGIPHAAITDDSNLTDDRLKARAFLEAPVPFIDLGGVRLGVAGDLTRRQGTWTAHNLDHAQNNLRVAVTITMSL